MKALKIPPKKATFAGGCFWCMEAVFDRVEGVLLTTSGYTGGRTSHPTYEEVLSGTTGHAEAVEILYDPSRVTYEKLLDVFWRNIDPTAVDRQFSDVGSQYRTAIFYRGEDERRLAAASKEKLSASGKRHQPIATEIVPAGEFYAAEEYHQDYYLKHAVRYQMYRKGSGRDEFLTQMWDKQSERDSI